MARIVRHNVNIFSKGNEFLLYLQTFFEQPFGRPNIKAG